MARHALPGPDRGQRHPAGRVLRRAVAGRGVGRPRRLAAWSYTAVGRRLVTRQSGARPAGARPRRHHRPHGDGARVGQRLRLLPAADAHDRAGRCRVPRCRSRPGARWPIGSPATSARCPTTFMGSPPVRRFFARITVLWAFVQLTNAAREPVAAGHPVGRDLRARPHRAVVGADRRRRSSPRRSTSSGRCGGTASPSTGGRRPVPRDPRALTLRTADGLTLAADAWLPAEPSRRRWSSWSTASPPTGATRRSWPWPTTCAPPGTPSSSTTCGATASPRACAPSATASGIDVAGRHRGRPGPGAPRGAGRGVARGDRRAAPRRRRSRPGGRRHRQLAGAVEAAQPARRGRGRADPHRRRAGGWRARLGARLDPTWRWTDPPDALAARITVPLAVVHGTGDRFMPTSEAEILHAAGAGADAGHRRLDLVPDMGHAFCTRGPGRSPTPWPGAWPRNGSPRSSSRRVA